MSTEGQNGSGAEGNSTPPAPDAEVKNLKSEFSRKFENITAQLQEQNKQFEAVLNSLAQRATPSKPEPSGDEDDIGVDPIDDPKKFAKVVREKATREATAHATKAVAEQQRVAQEQTSTLKQLVSEFPEIDDQNSEMYKRAVEISKQMSPEHRTSAVGLRAAVLSAAAELGVLAMSKRQKGDDSDDFSVNSGSRTSRSGSRDNQRREKTQVTDRSKAFAELLGRPVDDPEYLKRLEKTSGRKDWGKWR